MAHVITQSCCNDASCVPACPVDCIHPTPEEPDYLRAEMLYIDPAACIDCGACIDACPVSAVVPDYDLAPEALPYKEMNAAYYFQRQTRADGQPADSSAYTPSVQTPHVSPTHVRPLRVAIVGSGPAALYAAEELLSQTEFEIEVSIFEKLVTPFGLIRFGVAPDHLGTKSVARSFQKALSRPNVDCYLNVEIGSHLTHEELLEHHNAIVYAVGAPDDQKLKIPGEDKPGSHSATEFVAWYNGHPDHAHQRFDFSTERAVVIGNGNVALDVARILLTPHSDLVRTDIAQHALDALTESHVKEVVVIGRRGPVQAAYTNPEFLALGSLDGIDVAADRIEASTGQERLSAVQSNVDPIHEMKVRLATEYAARPNRPAARRIVFRYLLSPQDILGYDRVEGIRLVRNELVQLEDGRFDAKPTSELEDIDCGLVFRSIGYRGVPVADLPTAGTRATLANKAGRVIDPSTQEPLTGVYTAGWIKRGPSGVIGTNKKCARETVTSLLEDFRTGRLVMSSKDRSELRELVTARRPDYVGYDGWKAIDAHERRLGREAGRRRIKLVDKKLMLSIAASAQQSN